jgi:hypothetical protein
MSEFKESFRDEFLVSYYCDNNEKKLQEISTKLGLPKIRGKQQIFNKILQYFGRPLLTNAQKDEIKEKTKEKRLINKKRIEDEKEQKRIEKVNQQKLKAPKAGTKVKGRDGSTRHGYIISYSLYHPFPITIQDYKHRNELLKIDNNQCFWCKSAKKEDNDHAYPCCNTTEHEYSHTNSLNIFPSCKSCNSKKGGKKLEDWTAELQNKKLWTSIEIDNFKNWIYLNKEKLLLNKEDTDFVEKQFSYINKFHELCEQSAREKTQLKTLIIGWGKEME